MRCACVVSQTQADGVFGEVVEVHDAAHGQLLHVRQEVAHLLRRQSSEGMSIEEFRV